MNANLQTAAALDLTFIEESHSYYIGGVELPGVTRVLDKFIIDLSMVNADDLERGRILGHQVHKATALDDLGTLDEADLDANLPHVFPYVRGWRMFRREMAFNPIGIEEAGYHPIYKFAGTLDRRGQVEGYRTLLDIKRSDTLMPSVGPQTSAYEAIHNIWHPQDRIERRAYVQLFEESYKFDWLDDPSDLSTFLACLTMFNFKLKHRKYFRNF